MWPSSDVGKLPGFARRTALWLGGTNNVSECLLNGGEHDGGCGDGGRVPGMPESVVPRSEPVVLTATARVSAASAAAGVIAVTAWVVVCFLSHIVSSDFSPDT